MRTRLSAILRAIARIGYHGYPYDPARREALAQRESRALLLRMAVALLAMMQVMMFAVPTYITVDGVEPEHRLLLEWASLTLTLPALLYSAVPFFRGAWRDVVVRRPGMDVPVALGLVAAFLASAHATYTGHGAVYYDSVTMFVALLLLARYLELVARRRAGDAIETVAKARPLTAERLVDGPGGQATEVVGAAALTAGDVVLVRPGATVPADGIVVDGEAEVEEAVLTAPSVAPAGIAPRARRASGAWAVRSATATTISPPGRTARSSKPSAVSAPMFSRSRSSGVTSLLICSTRKVTGMAPGISVEKWTERFGLYSAISVNISWTSVITLYLKITSRYTEYTLVITMSVAELLGSPAPDSVDATAPVVLS